ncbi:MAG: F0F1 ATP synthase subunit B [Bacteroidetes bacterium]|nr:MAG: F0F1 ATP synthase subunit B [Bacteroidota bacterium]
MTIGILLLHPLLSPSYGLIVWTLVAFLTVLFLLKKFAWGPILKSLEEREHSIQTALDESKKARQEMATLKSDNEKIIAEAKTQRDIILKEAREIKDKMIADAKSRASTEADRITTSARENIQNEKMAAITELKNQVAHLSIEIAEKILKQELSEKDKQKSIIKNLLEDVKMN